MRDLTVPILNSLLSGIVALDEKGSLLVANAAACEYLSVGREALPVGVNIGDTQALAPLVETWNEISHTHKPILRRETRFVSAAGIEQELGISATPLDGPDPFNGAVFLFTDMTERRTLERIAERNRQLASLGELTAGIVHELRSPISAISGMAELLIRKTSSEDDRRDTLEALLLETDRLEKSISLFLGFTRPYDISPSRCAPEEVAERALQFSGRRAKKKQVTLEYGGTPDLPTLIVDSSRLAQALANLLNNAVDATPALGKVTLTLSQRSDQMVYTVKDGGPGLHLKAGEDIFAPFFTQKEGGTGLGLSIAQRIVAAHHGVIQYGNLPGQGAWFEIVVPCQ